MHEKEIWFDWATFGKDGFVDGVKKDAPENVKQAYQEYLERKTELGKKGIKI